jgi:hypothetical protein
VFTVTTPKSPTHVIITLPSGIIFAFTSKISLSESPILDFDIEVLQGLMSSLIEPEEIYFITEIKGSVGTNIDEQVFMHFMSNQDFTMSGMTENNNIDMNINLSFDNLDMGSMDEDDDNIECLKKTPSIDNILDKILEKGIDSLNLQDKKILQNFK